MLSVEAAGVTPMPDNLRDPLAPLTSAPARLLRKVAGIAISAGVRCMVRVDASAVADALNLGRHPLLVTNHRSPLDYFVLVAVCRARGLWPTMFAREDFFGHPLARWVLRALALIPASRGRGAREALSRATRLLESGQLLAIAAEGRLVLPEDRPDGVGRLRGGAGRLAQAGADLTVVTITGATRAWPPGRRVPRFALPWRRPVVTVRARRLRTGGLAAGRVNATVRAAMVELVGDHADS